MDVLWLYRARNDDDFVIFPCLAVRHLSFEILNNRRGIFKAGLKLSLISFILWSIRTMCFKTLEMKL